MYQGRSNRGSLSFPKIISTYCKQQGRSQDFSKGGWSYGSKSLEKENLLVIRIDKEST